MKNHILLCSFLFLAIPLASSQEGYRIQSNNKEKLSYIYFDINDIWKTGYSDAFVTSNSNKVPDEKVTVYAVDSSPQELLSGNSFMFTDLAGNQTMLSFTENSVIEFAKAYQTEINIEFTASGYRYTDPLLKKIIPEEYINTNGISSNRSIPSVTREVTLYTDGNHLYLAAAKHYGYTKGAPQGLLGKLIFTKNAAFGKTVLENKIAFLHTVEPLWPNIPYRFYDKTKPKNSAFKQTIQALVNGNSDNVKDSFFETFHNIFLWKLGNYFEDAIKERRYAELNYTYKNTSSTTLRIGTVTEERSNEVRILIPKRFESAFRKFRKEKHFNNAEGTTEENVFDVFFGSLQGYDDPRLKNLLINLEHYTNKEMLNRWLGEVNRIRSDYNQTVSNRIKNLENQNLKNANTFDQKSLHTQVNEYYHDKRRAVSNSEELALFKYKVEVTTIHWIPNDPTDIGPNSMGQYEFRISEPIYNKIPSRILYTKGINPENSEVRQVVRDLIAKTTSKTNATITMQENKLDDGSYEVVDIIWYWSF